MKSKLISLLFPFLILSSCGNQDCLRFKTGKFKLIDKELENAEFILERNDDYQIETNLKTGGRSKYKITWISPCEYHLLFVEGGEDIQDIFNGKVLEVKIIETYSDGYKFSAHFDGYEWEGVNTVKKID